MRVCVIGAGPAGLAAAYELMKAGARVTVLEAGDDVGGLCRSPTLWGQTVDLGPHRFFSTDRRVNSLWLEIAGKDYRLVDRLTRILYGGKLFHYPLKAFDALANLGALEAARCMASYARERMQSREIDDASFEEWVISRFGRRLYEIFFKTYSEKLWGIPCRDLDADFAAQRIKGLSLGEAVKAALLKNRARQHKTLVDQFAYPVGGTGLIYRRMAEAIVSGGGEVRKSARVGQVVVENGAARGVRLSDGALIEADHVISTMPLTQLVLGLDELPEAVRHAAGRLRFRNTVLVYLHVDAAELFPDNWLYVHSPELRFGRVTNFRNWVPELYGEARTTVLASEYWCNDDDADWLLQDGDFIHRAERELRATGLLGSARVLDGKVVRIRRCYPIYDRGYRQHVDVVAGHLRGIEQLWAIGRYGSFKYNNQDHSLLMGILAAENIARGTRHDLWTVNEGGDYQEATRITATGLSSDERAVA